MSVDIIVRSGDTQPRLQRTLYDSAGVPINLTGYTISFEITDPNTGVVAVSGACVVIGPSTDGVVAFDWPTVGVPTSGFYFARYVLVDANDTIHIPNATPLSLLFTNDTSHEYSYSGNPALRVIDRTRFLIQDTDMSKAILSDAEITFLNTEWKNPYVAAGEAATIIGTRYSSYADKTVGPLSIKYSDQSQRYFSLAQSLKSRGSANTGALVILTQVERDPIFTIGMGDNNRGKTSYLLGNQT